MKRIDKMVEVLGILRLFMSSGTFWYALILFINSRH